jgi:hypothetical protein
MLKAPDTVLIERNLGKRIDPQTGGMTVCAPPTPQFTEHLVCSLGTHRGYKGGRRVVEAQIPESGSELENAGKPDFQQMIKQRPLR